MQSVGIKRVPISVLRPFVKLVWANDETPSECFLQSDRERLLPTGSMHLVYRLSGPAIRIFDSIDDCKGSALGFGVVAGLRSRYYVKDVANPVRTVGALLQPGACRLLFGVTADELAERHTPIGEIWGRNSTCLYDQLQETNGLSEQLEVFESHLAERFRQYSGIHCAVAHALSRFQFTTDIGQIVKETGFSHRRFIQLFRTTVGLSPKLYCRILRFQQTLKSAGSPEISWMDIALQAGYSDQAHFNREFREFTGISPGDYRNLRQNESHHVPIPNKQGEPGGRSNLFNTLSRKSETIASMEGRK